MADSFLNNYRSEHAIADHQISSPIGTIRLPRSWKNFEEVILSTAGIDADDTQRLHHSQYSTLAKQAIKTASAEYRSPNRVDTSLGGNEAINALWSFCRDDDLVPPLWRSGESDPGTGGPEGIGRFYSQAYQDTGQLLHMIMGSPEYQGMLNYLWGGNEDSNADLLYGNDGSTTLGARLGRALTSAGTLLIQIPFMPLTGAAKIAGVITNFDDISKFMSFRPNMVVYYAMVNSTLNMLAAGMGLGTVFSADAETGGLNEAGLKELYAELGSPRTIREGWDIIRILSRRYRRQVNGDSGGQLGPGDLTLDEITNTYKGNGGLADSILEGISYVFEHISTIHRLKEVLGGGNGDKIINAMTGGYQYMTFRVNAANNSTESFANQTKESALAARMNSESQENIDKEFQIGGGTRGIWGLDYVAKAWRAFTSGAYGKIKLRALADQRYGSGFFDIPEIWGGSTVYRNYSFDIQLRAPLGDPGTVFESIYVPLICILCAAAPRQLGKNMYTAPPLIRAYCKGQFAVPLGMVDSLTITRGGDKSWTLGMLPTAVDVTFSIRDLSPLLCMGLTSVSDLPLFNLFNHNVGLHEYISTLSGVGFRERYRLFPQLRRMVDSSLNNLKNFYSPVYLGHWLTDKIMGSSAGNLPVFDDRLSNN